MDKVDFNKLLKEYDDNIVINKIVGGNYKEQSSNSTKLHRHIFYQIVWIYKGDGTHIIEGNHFIFKKGSIFLLAPHYLHKISYNSNVEGFVISFCDSVLDSIQNKATLLFHNIDKCFIQIPNDEIELLNKELELLYHYVSKGLKNNSLSIIQNYLHIILIKINRWKFQNINTNDSNTNNNLKILEQFNSLVRKHFKSQKQIDFYCDTMAITSKKLNGIIKKTTGLTPSKYLEHYTLNESARMLRYSSLSVKEIALDLGYSDNSYFTKMFKKHFHHTPKEYQNLPLA